MSIKIMTELSSGGLTFCTENYAFLKVALSQKILENFYISNIIISNDYPEQKILIFCLKQ